METTTATKTRDDLEKLKEDWLRDPCYDITSIEGFEAYADELAAFEQAQNVIWDAASQQRAARQQAALIAKADALGIPGNTALASYIIALEKRIAVIEAQIDNAQ